MCKIIYHQKISTVCLAVFQHNMLEKVKHYPKKHYTKYQLVAIVSNCWV